MVFGVCVFSQVSGPDRGPNATYLYLSGLENLNYCTFSSTETGLVWFTAFAHKKSQFNISAFSLTSGNKLISQNVWF